MTMHFQNEVQALQNQLVELSGKVEDQLHRAVEAIRHRDVKIASSVLDGDHAIDMAEVNLEEECLKILALHQPVAHDLRFIIAVLKMNNDLERIGDLAVNIARRAIFLASEAMPGTDYDFSSMAAKTSGMVRESLDALLREDVRMAEHVRESDKDVDEDHRNMYEQIKKSIRETPQHLDALINLLSISRNLERIADHATNIAEDVIYLYKGEIVRHRCDHDRDTDD